MVEVVGLERRFDDVLAVAGVSFTVGEGEVFGLLGPNGAGKSTTIKMLCTLLAPTRGTARVAGHDVLGAPAAVRAALGLLFQDPSVDDRLTARENLWVHCLIYGVPRGARTRRIDEALGWVELVDDADHLVRTFSGGMRRRLEVARALLHRPRVLVLDEPTTGLDPQTRRAMWERLLELRARDRITILMTTHYLEEAEHCDRLAIIDRGRLIAEGTPASIRARAGTERIAMSTADDPRAAAELHARFGVEVQRTERGLEFPVENGARFLPELARFPVVIETLTLCRPTLEDAFIALTGRRIRAEEASNADRIRGAAWRRRGRG
jgi:ABC-2 type transport system ATP-binding protein